MPGRKPIPTALKLLHNKRRINRNEPTPEAGTPEIPEWLKAFPLAVSEWQREARQLEIMGVLTLVDVNEFAWRCYIGSAMQELAADLQAEGRTLKPVVGEDENGPIYGSPKTNPKAVQLAHLLTEYRQIGGLFGFDPASRSKLVITPKAEPNSLEAFRNRKKVK